MGEETWKQQIKIKYLGGIKMNELLNNIGIIIFVFIFFIFCTTAALLDEKFDIFRKLKRK